MFAVAAQEKAKRGYHHVELGVVPQATGTCSLPQTLVSQAARRASLFTVIPIFRCRIVDFIG
jgi:enoyl-CoA hydratase/carnithine racemase